MVGLAALIFIATTFLRKRRRKQFEKDVDAAAAEAAATSHRGEEFYDDETGYNGGSGTGAYGNLYAPSTLTGPYSDGSHGVYTSPPMPLSPETYPMSDMALYPEYPSASDGGALALGGAAGVGAAMARNRSMTSGGGHEEPYAAYAGPPGGLYDYSVQPGAPPPQNLRYRNPGSSQDHGEEEVVGAGRNVSPTSTAPRPPSESYASHYASSTAPITPPESDPFRRATMMQPPPMPNPYGGDEYPERESYEDESEQDHRAKVLKVANE